MPSFNISFGSGKDNPNSESSHDSFGEIFQLPPKMKALITVGAGIVFLIVGIFSFILSTKPDTRTGITQGVVVSVEGGPSAFTVGNKTEFRCAPTVEYVVDGVTYLVSDIESGEVRQCPWVEGDLETVRYNPNNPDDATLGGAPSVLFSYLFITVGVVLLGGGVWGFIKTK